MTVWGYAIRRFVKSGEEFVADSPPGLLVHDTLAAHGEDVSTAERAYGNSRNDPPRVLESSRIIMCFWSTTFTEMSTEAPPDVDPYAARQLAWIIAGWLVFVLGGGLLLVIFL